MAKSILRKVSPATEQKPTISEADQKVWVGSSLGTLSDHMNELAVHIDDLETLLYERQDVSPFHDHPALIQTASMLLGIYAADVRSFAESVERLGRIADARGVDAVQKGGAA